jgi:hypothetical protein
MLQVLTAASSSQLQQMLLVLTPASSDATGPESFWRARIFAMMISYDVCSLVSMASEE